MGKLPGIHRPRGGFTKNFSPGIDLPSWFNEGLKAIDHKLYLVYHLYEVMWDDIINSDEGPTDNPRFCIHQEHGYENWGWVLKNRDGSPKLEATWHIWRLCEPHGWAHIASIMSNNGGYLSLLLSRLHIQATFREKYGDIAWNKLAKQQQEEELLRQQEEKNVLFNAVQEENNWLTKRAMENMASGRIKPTNPTKNHIISYPGQGNRSKIIRPITDEEGGLITPGK